LRKRKRTIQPNTKFYCVKFEVCIRNSPPYVALFQSSQVPGSVHDFEIFKRNCKQYERYLGTNFSLLADKGYIGSASHQYNRVIPAKYPKSGDDRTLAKEISAQRSRVEQYFGKLKMFFPAPGDEIHIRPRASGHGFSGLHLVDQRTDRPTRCRAYSDGSSFLQEKPREASCRTREKEGKEKTARSCASKQSPATPTRESGCSAGARGEGRRRRRGQ